MHGNDIFQAGTCTLTFLDDAVLHAAGQGDDAGAAAVFTQELLGARLVVVRQLLERGHALLADLLLQFHHDLPHFGHFQPRLALTVGIANRLDDGLQIEIDVKAAQIGAELVADGITQLACLGFQVLGRDRCGKNQGRSQGQNYLMHAASRFGR